MTPTHTAERDTRAIVLDAPPLRTVCTENGVCPLIGDYFIRVEENPYYAGLRKPRAVSESVLGLGPINAFNTRKIGHLPYWLHWRVTLYRHDSAGREWSTTVPMVVDCYGDLVEVQP